MHRSSRFAQWIVAATFCLSGVVLALPAAAAVKEKPAPPPPKLDNASCQVCHDGEHGKLEMPVPGEDKKRVIRAVNPGKYGKSVHAKMECIACHTDLVDTAIPHAKNAEKAPDCAACHEALWEKAKQDPKQASEKPRLETVVKNAEAYRRSFHAGEDKDHPGHPKAVCTQCHDTHAFHVPADKKSAAYAEWRKDIPLLCGSCHDEQLDTYKDSIHGKKLLEEGEQKAPSCNSCHTTHEITNTSLTSFKLLITEACGNCHQDRLTSYRDTYHGQVTKLGFPETAKCYNCHGSHGILPAKDPRSTVNVANRLKTCQACHDGKARPLATAGFVTFGPHANAHDFAKYPQMWIVTKFMQGLLIMVFAFFWAHSGL